MMPSDDPAGAAPFDAVQTADAYADAPGTICALFLYPIKGCRGVATSRLDVGPGGARGDRRYMVVDADGRFLTQRTHPKLALVDCHVEEDGSLDVQAASQPAVRLSPPTEEQQVLCRIWRDEVRVRVVPAGSRWFSHLLGEAVELVHLAEADLRQVNPKYASLGDLVGLADGYPLLWTNEASLGDLNRHTESEVPMDRFRPNVVTRGLPPYREDTAERILLGGSEFFVPKLCDRCVVTTTDQRTGERGREPLRALSRHRKWDQAVWFGANLIPTQDQARRGMTLVVGDPVRIVADRPHPRHTEG